MNRSLLHLAGVAFALMMVPATVNAQSAVPVSQGSVLVSGEVRTKGQQLLPAGEALTVTAAILKAGGAMPNESR